jgi:hypothetical protein
MDIMLHSAGNLTEFHSVSIQACAPNDLNAMESRRVYVYSFMGLAFLFVPVLFHYFLVWMIAPCLSQLLLILWQDWNAVGLVFAGSVFVYVTFYMSVFHLIAQKTFAVTERLPPSEKAVLRLLILGGLFSCSFLRAIKGAGLVTESGIYTFWEALEGCLKR